jgi:hypothetical protein
MALQQVSTAKEVLAYILVPLNCRGGLGGDGGIWCCFCMCCRSEDGVRRNLKGSCLFRLVEEGCC